jgi:hypothetical protein
MSITGMCGFEVNTVGEFTSVVGSPSIQSAIVHSPGFAMRINAPFVATYAVFQSRPSGGTLAANFWSVAFYVYVNAASAANCLVWSIGPSGGSPTALLRFNNDLTVNLNINGFSANSVTKLIVGQWNRVVVGLGTSVFANFVFINGVFDIQSVNSTTVAQVEMRLGEGVVTGEGTDWDLVFDDVRWYNSSVASDVGEYKVALLIPTAGNNANGWTSATGGTGDIHTGVANIPPTGVLAETAGHKINNATSTTTGDYVATMQTYSVAGVPPLSIINAVNAICSHGEEITTGNPKPGAIWVASNPAQTAGTGTFDYGDNVIEGTYPTGWPTHIGPVSSAPVVTLSTAPTVTIRKNLASTRVVACCFMGLYVDYTPPPIGTVKSIQQAINRASTF